MSQHAFVRFCPSTVKFAAVTLKFSKKNYQRLSIDLEIHCLIRFVPNQINKQFGNLALKGEKIALFNKGEPPQHPQATFKDSQHRKK